jgi:hypothetical protein
MPTGWKQAGGMTICLPDIGNPRRKLFGMGVVRRAIPTFLMLVALFVGVSAQGLAAVSAAGQPCQVTMTRGNDPDAPCKSASRPDAPACLFAPACIGVVALEPAAPHTPNPVAAWREVWYGDPPAPGVGRSIRPDLFPPIPSV